MHFYCEGDQLLGKKPKGDAGFAPSWHFGRFLGRRCFSAEVPVHVLSNSCEEK